MASGRRYMLITCGNQRVKEKLRADNQRETGWMRASDIC